MANLEQDERAAIAFQANNATIQTGGGSVGSNNINAQGDVQVTYNVVEEGKNLIAKIVAWLRSPSNYYRLVHDEAYSKRVAETLKWLFDLETYNSWLKGSGAETRCLECIGMPGTGKTILASAIIEDLQRRFDSRLDPTCIVIYAYFRNDLQSQQTAPIVFANLLSQLVHKTYWPSYYASELFNEYGADGSTTLPRLDKTITALRSEMVTYSKVYIVVDALDEYSDHLSSQALVKELQKLDAKVLITSRRPVGFTSGTYSQIIVAANEDDIRALIQQQISTGRLAAFIKRSPDLREEIMNKICAKSKGVFLIARLLVDWICSLRTINAVRDALNNLPSGLDEAYRRMMERITNQDEDSSQLAILVLSWIYLAQRQLTVAELRHAVAFESSNMRKMMSDDDLFEEDDILSACAGLVVFVEGKAHFFHFTLSEFFDKHSHTYFPYAQRRITETCLRYLNLAAPLVPRDIISHTIRDGVVGIGQKHLQAHPLCDYAASEWAHHAAYLDDIGATNYQLVFDFFQHPIAPYLASYWTSQIRVVAATPSHQYQILFFARYGLHALLKMHLEKLSAKATSANTAIAEINVQDGDGRTAIHLAAWKCHMNIVNLLLENGADPNIPDSAGRAPLTTAAMGGHFDIMTVLLEHGAKPNIVEKRGSVSAQDIKDLGASLDQVGWTPLHFAAAGGHNAILKTLLEQELDVDAKDDCNQTPLLCAAWYGHAEAVKTLFERGADLNSRNNKGQTPLHVAASRDQSETVTTLLKKGADPNSRNEEGETAFFIVARMGHAEVAKILLENPLTDPRLPDNQGKTPLRTALDYFRIEVVTLIVEKGFASADEGQQAFFASPWEESPALTRLLLQKGLLDPNAPNEDGRIPLYQAAQHGWPETTSLLLEHGANANGNTDGVHGSTPLWQAIYFGHPDITEMLLEQGAELEPGRSIKRMPRNVSYMLSAAYRGYCRSFKLLIDHGVDVDRTLDRQKRASISYAAEGRAVGIVRLLLETRSISVEADRPDGSERAPISYAISPDPEIWWKWVVSRSTFRPQSVPAEVAATEIVRLLLDRGVDIHRVDKNGETPLLLARKSEIKEVREMVEQYALTCPVPEATIPVINGGEREDEEVAAPTPPADEKAQLSDGKEVKGPDGVDSTATTPKADGVTTPPPLAVGTQTTKQDMKPKGMKRLTRLFRGG